MSNTTQAHTNFGFLMEHSPLLHKLGLLAEKNHAAGPSTRIVHDLIVNDEPASDPLAWLRSDKARKSYSEDWTYRRWPRSGRLTTCT